MPGVPSQVVTYDPLRGINSVEEVRLRLTIGSTRYDNTEREYYETNEFNPAASRPASKSTESSGRGATSASKPPSTSGSDSTAFHVRVLRRISEKGKLVRQKEFKESIRREFH